MIIFLYISLFVCRMSAKPELIAGDTLHVKTGTVSDVKYIRWKEGKLRIAMTDGKIRTAIIRPMGSIIGKDLEVDEVNDAGDKVALDSVDAAEMLKGCDFSGVLEGDPDSRLTMTTCNDGYVLLTVVSDVFDFKLASYRFLSFRRVRRRKKRSAEKDKKSASSEEEDMIDNTHASYNALKKGVKSFDEIEARTRKFFDYINTKKSGKLDKWASKIESIKELENPKNFQILKEKKKGKENYKTNTIEIAVITDPVLYQMIKERINGTDDEVVKRLYNIVHEVLISVQAFLLHPSISKYGGIRLQLNGLKIMKEWGYFKKMSERNEIRYVLHDLGNYLKMINHNWDGHYHSYDAALFLTGRDDYPDGDAYSYIGHVCLVDCPMVSKMLLVDGELHPNMGRLVAHEIGHLMGASHDEDTEDCQPGIHIMSETVNTTMHAWSECSRKSIDKVLKKRVEQTNCLMV